MTEVKVQEQHNMATLIAADESFNVDATAGLITLDREAHLNFSKEGVDKKSIKLHEDSTKEIVKGFTEVVGAEAVKLMSKDKKLDSVSGKMLIGTSKVEVEVRRSKEVSGGLKDGKALPRKITTGATSVKVRVNAGGKALDEVRRNISLVATKKLK